MLAPVIATTIDQWPTGEVLSWNIGQRFLQCQIQKLERDIDSHVLYVASIKPEGKAEIRRRSHYSCVSRVINIPEI